MQITEKDIYYYIMHKEYLSEDKFKYIQKNINQFIEEITFLKEFKENLSAKVSPGIIAKVHSSIDDANKNKIVLKPIINDLDSQIVRFAAESFNIAESPKSFTLYDDKKEFLIKINSTDNQSKIYFFTLNLLDDKIFPIKLNPSGDKYFINIDDQPLVVDSVNEIDSIELSFS